MADVITRFKVDTAEYDRKVKSASSTLKSFEKSLGVSVSTLTKVSVAAAAVSGALKVANDAFFATEKGIDSWGRTTKAASSTYNAFLQSLNNGNFSAFFSNLDGIIDRAKKAYDSLDALGTMTSFSDVDLQKIQTQRMNLQLKIKQGKANGTDVSGFQAALLGLDDDLERLAREKAELAATAYNDELKLIVTSATGGWWNSELAHKYADSWDGFKQVTEDRIKELEKELAGRADPINYILNKQRGIDVSGHIWDDARRTVELQHELKTLIAIRDNEAAIVQAKQLQVTAEQALQQATQARLSSIRYTTDTSGSSSSSTDPFAKIGSKIKPFNGSFNAKEFQKSLDEFNKKNKVVFQTGIRDYAVGSITDLNKQLATATGILNDLTIGTDAYNQQLERVVELQQMISAATRETTADTRDSAKAWMAAGSAINSVGTAMTAIDDPTAKIIGLIAQAIASVASGAGQAMAAKDTTSSGWAWIGAAAAITAEMVAIISTIKSSTEYHAGGGMVGMARGTDTVPAMLTPGELVLNRAQQQNLANQLNGGVGNMQLSATLRGEDIILAINNTGRRMRQGEYIRSR